MLAEEETTRGTGGFEEVTTAKEMLKKLESVKLKH
jgi:hypothetical protein